MKNIIKSTIFVWAVCLSLILSGCSQNSADKEVNKNIQNENTQNQNAQNENTEDESDLNNSEPTSQEPSKDSESDEKEQSELLSFSSDDYSLKYGKNWTNLSFDGNMTLYYNDASSVLQFNGVSPYKFGDIDENYMQSVYDMLYNMYIELSPNMNMTIAGGSGGFSKLNDELYYAEIDYNSNAEPSGKIYITVSEEKDKVISFMSYASTNDIKAEFEKDCIDVLKTLDMSNTNIEAIKFEPGEVKEYSALAYMDYSMPDCWTYDEEMSKSVDYKHYVFKYGNNEAMLAVAASTVYNKDTLDFGTSYDSMINTISETYGSIENDETVTHNDIEWRHVTSPMYVDPSSEQSYYNEIYFHISDDQSNMYYFECYILYSLPQNKIDHINESIAYILSSAKLLRNE